MKGAINGLGSEIPVRKVICAFHLFSSFVMSHCTEHLIIQSLSFAAPDKSSEQRESGARSPQTRQPHTPAGTPTGSRCSVWTPKALSVRYALRWVTVRCCSVQGNPDALQREAPGKYGHASAEGLRPGVCVSLQHCHEEISQRDRLNSRNLFSHGLEARNPRLRYRKGGILLKPLLACRWPRSVFKGPFSCVCAFLVSLCVS